MEYSVYALENLMEVDHVIRVHEDGTVSEPSGVWAPEVYDNGPADGPEDIQVDSPTGHVWTLLSGWSDQYCYRGPVMHPSEYVGGALAQHILDTPGFWVMTIVNSADGLTDGWVLAHWGPDANGD